MHQGSLVYQVCLQNTIAWEQFSIAMQKFAKQYKEGESERFDTVVKPYMTIIMCVTVESPVSGSPDYVAYTGPAE